MSTTDSPVEPPHARRPNSAVRDHVTMGVFIALYIVLFMFCGVVMAAVPLIMVLLPVIFGLFGGLIFTVLLGKVQRPGAFLITGLILGPCLVTMAPGGTMCRMTILGGVAAEIIHSRLGRRSFRSMRSPTAPSSCSTRSASTSPSCG